jgi:hypothetical protein
MANTEAVSVGEDDYESIQPLTVSDDKRDQYIARVKKDFRYDLLAHDNYIQGFDAYEAMLISRPYDSVSRKVQNGLSDGRTTTIYQERAARVCGQLPDGNMKAAGKKDEGASQVLDIMLQKYVYPNANAQAPLLEKFRNWQFYSSVYGFMPMYYDWDAKQNGYVGPECWLWHPRNFIPQIGRTSIDDMDYCTALTFVGVEFLKGLKDEDEEAGWDQDEIDILLDLIEERTRFPDNRRDSLITRERQSQADKGRIMLATRYEAGEEGNWTVFAPEYNGVTIRMIRNPHKNGKIPFVIKYATPLFDNFYGLGDFQRAKPLQFASDGLDNFYFAGLKRGLYPPTIINPAGVVKSSITQDPGAIWQETVANSIREYQTSPVGLNTYQAAKTLMNAALLNQAGTTDTAQTTSDSSDPNFSKTPQGLAQQQQRENARDNQDRFYLESRIETLIDRMMGLFATIGTEDVPVDLFVDDFEDIEAAGWGDDLKGMLDISDSEQSAHMTIKPSFFNEVSIRFHLDPGSTAFQDKQTQLSNLESFIQSMSSMQNEMVDMKAQGMTIDWTLVAKLEEQLSDVPEMGKIFRQMTPQEMQLYQQQQQQGQAQEKPPETVDTLAFKDLPEWAQTQWLGAQGFSAPTDPQTGQPASPTSTDTQIKQQELALKEKQAQQASAPKPTPAPTDLTVHRSGRVIQDPTVANTHNKIAEMGQKKIGDLVNANTNKA